MFDSALTKSSCLASTFFTDLPRNKNPAPPPTTTSTAIPARSITGDFDSEGRPAPTTAALLGRAGTLPGDVATRGGDFGSAGDGAGVEGAAAGGDDEAAPQSTCAI